MLNENNYKFYSGVYFNTASIAQLGERKTEDLEAPCSIHGRSIYFFDSLIFSFDSLFDIFFCFWIFGYNIVVLFIWYQRVNISFIFEEKVASTTKAKSNSATQHIYRCASF